MTIHLCTVKIGCSTAKHILYIKKHNQLRNQTKWKIIENNFFFFQTETITTKHYCAFIYNFVSKKIINFK